MEVAVRPRVEQCLHVRARLIDRYRLFFFRRHPPRTTQPSQAVLSNSELVTAKDAIIALSVLVRGSAVKKSPRQRRRQALRVSLSSFWGRRAAVRKQLEIGVIEHSARVLERRNARNAAAAAATSCFKVPVFQFAILRCVPSLFGRSKWKSSRGQTVLAVMSDSSAACT